MHNYKKKIRLPNLIRFSYGSDRHKKQSLNRNPIICTKKSLHQNETGI